MTVTDLKAKGATQLGDAQLKALIVGKAFWVRNNATGEQFSVAYTAEGQSNVWHIGRNATIPSYVGNPIRDGYQGTTTPYKIEGGKVVTNDLPGSLLRSRFTSWATPITARAATSSAMPTTR